MVDNDGISNADGTTDIVDVGYSDNDGSCDGASIGTDPVGERVICSDDDNDGVIDGTSDSIEGSDVG